MEKYAEILTIECSKCGREFSEGRTIGNDGEQKRGLCKACSDYIASGLDAVFLASANSKVEDKER